VVTKERVSIDIISNHRVKELNSLENREKKTLLVGLRVVFSIQPQAVCWFKQSGVHSSIYKSELATGYCSYLSLP